MGKRITTHHIFHTWDTGHLPHRTAAGPEHFPLDSRRKSGKREAFDALLTRIVLTSLGSSLRGTFSARATPLRSAVFDFENAWSRHLWDRQATATQRSDERQGHRNRAANSQQTPATRERAQSRSIITVTAVSSMNTRR
jgi:hypothetical protein